MRRRALLQRSVALAPLLAGCLRTDGGAWPTARAQVAIVQRDDPPDLPVRPSIEVVAPSARRDRPPELRARVENTSADPVEVGEERAVVFAFVSSERQPGLVLLPADGGYEPVRPGCWRLASPIAIAAYYGVVSLAPGEATERRLGVWGGHDVDGCLPTGRFRFVTTYAGGPDRTDGVDAPAWSGDWGFTLEVT